LRRFSIPYGRPGRALFVAALLLILSLELVHMARVCSATWDEPHHLYDGYTIWTKQDYRLNAEVPPLVKLTAALPLLAMHLNHPPSHGRSQAEDAFLDGRSFVFDNGGDRVLFPARMACMLFTLALAWLIYAATRELFYDLFGDVAAFLALGLFVFDPNVLANGALVTTDLGSACCIFGAVYAFYRYVRSPSLLRLGIAGVAAGLALVAKFTGILIVPMLLVLALAEALRTRSFAVLGRRLAACACILLCAWIVLWAFYGFRYKPAPGALELSPRLAPYLQSMPNNGKDSTELALTARFHLLPEPYIWGLANTKKTEWEYTSYFFGRVYRHGPWEYFPAAFLIKSTLPLLILLALFPFLWFRARPQTGAGKARELYFLLIPVCVYFAVVSSSHFDIGARHLLPIYPFLYVLAAAGASSALRRGPAWATAVGVLLVWQVVSSVRVAPEYMAYGNEAWGGPSQVHRYLGDANVDWGQQLKAVKLYLDRNHVTNFWFAYFPDGAIEPSDYGVHCRRLPTGTALWWLRLPMQVPPVIDGTVLISDGVLEGVEFGDGKLNPYESFRGMKPTAVIQHGVNVYRGSFAVPLASALVAVRASGDLAKAGQMQAALDAANQAVQLAPDSATAQLNLAATLAGQAQWRSALEHYQAAETLARTIRPSLQADLLPQIAAGLTAARSHLPS
jgi:4-amino-4-deoxy-L-arabinose transferase-like glycosyltransferase